MKSPGTIRAGSYLDCEITPLLVGFNSHILHTITSSLHEKSIGFPMPCVKLFCFLCSGDNILYPFCRPVQLLHYAVFLKVFQAFQRDPDPIVLHLIITGN